MKLLRFAVGLVAAVVLHTLGTRWWETFPAAIDLFLVLAVIHSLDTGLGWSTASGSASGLARDGLSGGLYGLHGFANTLVAHLSARLQQHLTIRQPLQVGCLFVLAAALQLTILAVLQFLLVPGAGRPDPGTMVLRMASSGLLGAALFVLAGKIRAAQERWREQRRRRLTI